MSNFLFQFFLIDLPEMVFIILFFLVFYNKKLIEFTKVNVLKILSTSFILTLFEDCSDIIYQRTYDQMYIRLLVLYLAICATLIILYNIFQLKKIANVFVYIFICIFVMQLIEYSLIGLMLLISGIKIEDFISDLNLVFVFSIPVRIIEFLILIKIYNRKIIK